MKDIERDLRRSARRISEERAEDAARGLAARAEREGGLDVAVASVGSPLGDLLAAVTPRGLVRLSYLRYADRDATLQDLADRVSPRILESPERLDEVRRELEEYFDGRRRRFDIPVDWALTRGFGRRILRATARVPFGHVATYRDMARAAGSPRAVRAAGNALGSNPLPIVVPCHRIVRTGGGLGGYTGGVEKKEFLLALEGGSGGPAPD